MTAALAVTRSRRSVRIVLAVTVAVGLAALAWAAFVKPSARIVYNVTDSIPVGWYRAEKASSLRASLRVGGIVLTRLPGEFAELAAQRGYLPLHIPLLKRVGALAPQHVCIVEGIVRIDGTPVAVVLHADRWGRALPVWQSCRALVEGEVFLLSSTNPASFDSRYVGPVPASSVIGLVLPLAWPELP